MTCEVNHWALFLAPLGRRRALGPYALSYWVPRRRPRRVWEGLNDGTIDIISSDHAPHTREEKDIGWTQMWSAHTGTPGIQYYYPLLLDAVGQGLIDLRRAVDLACAAPGGAFGLAQPRAASRRAATRTVVIADLDAPWTIIERRRAVPLRLDALRRPPLPCAVDTHAGPRRRRLTRTARWSADPAPGVRRPPTSTATTEEDGP